MILTSTTERVRFTPPWREGQPDAPVFLLRAGSVQERGMLEAELAGQYRAGRIWQMELQSTIRDGISALLADDPEIDHILSLFEEEDETKLSDPDRQQRQSILNVLAEHWQPYRDLLAQLARRREMAPIVALRRFLVGFENMPCQFSRGPDGLVSDATLAAIEPLDLIVAGNFAYGLLYGGGMERFLEQPSASGDAPTTSSTDTAKVDG